VKRLALIVIALAVGCVSAVPEPQDPQLRGGRQRYIARCSGCHALHDVHEKTGAEWHVALDEMAARAKLTAAERDEIERYLRSVAP
jgi:hypothetical protein